MSFLRLRSIVQVLSGIKSNRAWSAVCALVIVPVLSSCSGVADPLGPPPDIYSDSPDRANVQKIYVFGDSISDTGNLFGIIDDVTPILRPRLQSPPARSGGQVLSNKYLSVEYVASHYGLGLVPAWEPTVRSISDFSKLDAEVRARISRHISRFRPAKQGIRLTPEEQELARDIMLQHAGGNNYAVAKAAIRSYPGDHFRFFNRFRLSKQISLHGKRSDPGKTLSNSLHFILIGGNDVFNILDNPTLRSNAEDHIALLVDEVETQIQRLRDMGAQKILVSTTPDIGRTPEFSKTALREKATSLSLLLDHGVRKRVGERFDPQHVRYASIPNFFNRAIEALPSDVTHDNCVVRRFSLGHFLLSDGEVRLKFMNGCSQEKLDAGDFVYFDSVHGTDALYREIGRLYVHEIDAFMGSS